MKLIKKIVLSGFAIFLCYRTYDLMRYLMVGNLHSYSIFESFVIAFLLSLFTTGVFAFPGFSFKTSSLLPASYYSIKYPELLNKMYQILGVHYFRKVLMVVFWGQKKNRAKYFDGSKGGLQNLIYQTKQSEFGHLGASIAIAGLSILLLAKGYWLIFGFMTLINIIGNIYPVILQRKHRLRIEKITSQTD